MGVCAGLADYFEVDPTLMRIIFIILTLGGGAGIIIYIVLALIMPLGPKKEDISMNNQNEEVKKGKRENKRVSFLGVSLLIIGSLLLWNYFSPIKIASEVFWASVMIAAGLWLVLRD